MKNDIGGGANHSGHRKRLVEKLARGALLEHEVLETLLCNASPRKNTNDIAHRLLAEFGSVPSILNAPLERLKAVDGVGESVAAYLRCVGTFCELYYAEYKERFPDTYEAEDFGTFVRREYTYLPNEILDCFLVDKAGKILQRKRFSSYAKDYAELDPKEFSEILSTRGVAGIVLVHNHPGAPSFPSDADHNLTKQCQCMCSFHNLILCNHIICGADGVYDYYREGLLQGISKNCSIQQLLAEVDRGEK